MVYLLYVNFEVMAWSISCQKIALVNVVSFNVDVQHCLAQSPVRRGDGPLALVLAPTRELAQQIEKEVRSPLCGCKTYEHSYAHVYLERM